MEDHLSALGRSPTCDLAEGGKGGIAVQHSSGFGDGRGFLVAWLPGVPIEQAMGMSSKWRFQWEIDLEVEELMRKWWMI